MRVLTVRQPWAWAIIHGGKNVENRTRNIAGTYRGPVAIQAGLKADLDAFRVPEIVGSIAMTKLFGSSDRWFSNSPHGAIIGVADLYDVHHSTDCFEPEPAVDGQTSCSVWAFDGHHHLMFRDARAIDPIPAKGRLGLWTPDSELETSLKEVLGG